MAEGIKNRRRNIDFFIMREFFWWNL